MGSFSILVVCTGNICRSPLTQQLLESGLAAYSEVQVSSAGTHALVGHGMPAQAQVLARELGVESPENHLARALSVEQLRNADLVIALARDHRREVVELLPRGARHTFTLRELSRLLDGIADEDFDIAREIDSGDFAGRLRELVEIAASRRGVVPPPNSPDDDDVIDPYRRDESVYRESARQILPAVSRLLEQMEHVRSVGKGSSHA